MQKILNMVKVCIGISEITLPTPAVDNAVLTQEFQMYFVLYKSSLMYLTFD